MLIVVGGHSRKIGKSSVVEGLIRALSEFQWTAIKISTHRHGAAEGGAPFQLVEETAPGSGDSGRYLLAGAVRAYWLRTGAAGLEPAVPPLRKILAESGDAIIESNTVLHFVRPDLVLFVADPAVEDWKKSAAELWDRADAVVLIDRGAGTLARAGRAGPPTFIARPPEWVSEQLMAFIRRRRLLSRRRE